jgi:hypothetical protein
MLGRPVQMLGRPGLRVTESASAARSQTVLPRLWYIPATMETPMAASAT